jgi:Fur family transcriptional regulator, peroxide stress response regulator
LIMRRETRQRNTILYVLKNTATHPTADQIYDEARKLIPNISKGTVYRNLRVLQEEGMITPLNLDGALGRYEVKQKGHYHFRCDKCGRVFDLDEPVDAAIDERVRMRTGFRVSHHQTEFCGLCKDCLGKKVYQ